MTGRLKASLTIHRVRQLGRYRLKTLWPMQPSCITLKLRAFITVTWPDILDKVSKHYQLFVNVFLPSCFLSNFFHFLSKRLYLLQLLLSFRLRTRNTKRKKYTRIKNDLTTHGGRTTDSTDLHCTILSALSHFGSLYCFFKGDLCFSQTYHPFSTKLLQFSVLLYQRCPVFLTDLPLC